MLIRASVGQVKSGVVRRGPGRHLVVAMRVYPRFLPKALTDEYARALSPQPELFEKYRALKKQSGEQNEAFEQAGYETTFALSDEGVRDLARLAGRSSTEDVHLICQCAPSERCHVDLMLLLAEQKLGAAIGALPFAYDDFRTRIRA